MKKDLLSLVLPLLFWFLSYSPPFLSPLPLIPILPLILPFLLGLPLSFLWFLSFPSASPPVGGSVGGYGYIVIEVARPSARPPASSEDVLKPSVKVVEIP
jgi:apolipoprotein N-acyltransferase